MRYFLIFALFITMGAGCTTPEYEFQAPHYDNGIFQSQNEILFIGRDTVKAEWSTDQNGNLFITVSDQDVQRLPLFAQAKVLYVRNGGNLFETNRGEGILNIADVVEAKSPQGRTFFIDVLGVVSK